MARGRDTDMEGRLHLLRNRRTVPRRRKERNIGPRGHSSGVRVGARVSKVPFSERYVRSVFGYLACTFVLPTFVFTDVRFSNEPRG